MGLKPGYKPTEVGLIPEDWEVKPLKCISPKQSVGLVINPSTYFDKAGTVPLLVGSNVAENFIDSTTANRITKSSNDLISASRLAAGDLVCVRVGDPGVTAVVPQELDGCNCASMMIVRQHLSFDSQWLCYVMNSPIGRRQIAHVQYGTAQKQYNISDAVDFRFPVPPLPEQRAIAEALSDVDALIGALDRLIAKKRDLKQAAMQQLLTGQKRLPGFSGQWEVKMLGDTCVFENGDRGTNYPSPASFAESGIPFVNTGHVVEGRIDRGVMDYITKESYARLGSGKFKPGDILFCLRGSLGKFGVVDSDFGEGAIASSLVIVRARPGSLRSDYLSCYFSSELCRRMIDKWAGGAAQPNLGGQDLARFLIPLPPLPEQTAIAEVLSDMDAEITTLERRRDKTRVLKHGMMQELLTGRTRLVDSPRDYGQEGL